MLRNLEPQAESTFGVRLNSLRIKMTQHGSIHQALTDLLAADDGVDAARTMQDQKSAHVMQAQEELQVATMATDAARMVRLEKRNALEALLATFTED